MLIILIFYFTDSLTFRLGDLSVDEMVVSRVCLLDFFSSGIQFYVLLSPYLCFVSFLCLDLYVFGDNALMG